MVHGGQKRTDMVSNNAQVGCSIWSMLNWSNLETIHNSMLKMYHENIPHAINPPPAAAWPVIRQDGATLSWCCQIVTNHQTRRGSGIVSCWSSPSSSWFHVLTVHRLYSLVVTSGSLISCCLYNVWKQSLLWFLTSKMLCLHTVGYLLLMGPVSVNPRDGCGWNNRPTHLFSPFWCSIWTSAGCLDNVYINKGFRLLPRDWSISYLRYKRLT